MSKKFFTLETENGELSNYWVFDSREDARKKLKERTTNAINSIDKIDAPEFIDKKVLKDSSSIETYERCVKYTVLEKYIDNDIIAVVYDGDFHIRSFETEDRAEEWRENYKDYVEIT